MDRKNKNRFVLISSIVICIALFFLIRMSGQKTRNIEPSQHATLVVDIVENAYNIISITFQIQNTSDSEVFCSEEAELHMLRNNKWYEVPRIRNDYVEVSYGIPVGTKQSFVLNLTDWYGPLEAGHYRLIKPIHGFGTGEYVVDEFCIA